jgi:predicted membrane protein
MSADDLSRDRNEGEGFPAEELRARWQEQPATAAALGEDTLRAHAIRVAGAHRRLRVLRALQPLGSVFGIAASLLVMLRFTDPLMRTGAALLALTFALHWIIPRRLLSAHEPDSAAGPRASAEPSLIAYRAALLYRLEEDRGLRMWLRLVIGVPAAALLLYGMTRVAPALRTIIAVEAVAVAFGLTLTVVHVVRRVRRYQAELDALDALESSL